VCLGITSEEMAFQGCVVIKTLAEVNMVHRVELEDGPACDVVVAVVRLWGKA
jgi:hypothetical protein